MPYLLIPWSFKRETHTGVELYEIDCEVECLVSSYGDAHGEPQLQSITSIYVYGDGKVADLLNSDSGAADIGELARKQILNDKAFATAAIEGFYDDRSGSKADAKRAMQAAE
jgi:hypothetical protein